MRRLVTNATPIGVLAFEGDEPVGWCSIAPRETCLASAFDSTLLAAHDILLGERLRLDDLRAKAP